MKGLLAKDFQLLMTDKRMLALVLGAMVLFGVFGGENMVIFVVGYVSFLSISIALTTFAWDDFDKCTAFLLTMPVTRRMYVIEKYVYGLLCLLVGWGIAMLFGVFLVRGSQGADQTDAMMVFFFSGLLILVLAFGMLVLMVPVRLKLGSDKGRMAQNTIIVGVVILVFVLARAFPGILEAALNVAGWMFGSGRTAALLLALAVLAVFGACSVAVSLRVMERREF